MKNFTTNDVREVLLQKLKNISPRAILQALFMAGGLFFENNLISFAASCTFGFLFSFIPIVMMIAVFLLHFLHASTDSLIALFGTDSIFFNVISAKSILSVIDSFRSFGRFEGVMSQPDNKPNYSVWGRDFYCHCVVVIAVFKQYDKDGV